MWDWQVLLPGGLAPGNPSRTPWPGQVEQEWHQGFQGTAGTGEASGPCFPICTVGLLVSVLPAHQGAGGGGRGGGGGGGVIGDVVPLRHCLGALHTPVPSLCSATGR